MTTSRPLALSDRSVLDTSLLFAVIMYSLAALFLRSAIDWLTRNTYTNTKLRKAGIEVITIPASRSAADAAGRTA